jgi:hypothetical protein
MHEDTLNEKLLEIEKKYGGTSDSMQAKIDEKLAYIEKLKADHRAMVASRGK